MNIVTEGFSYEQISSSTNVQKRSCVIGGIFVSSASSTPTITVYDSETTTTTTKVIDTFTPVGAQFYPIAASLTAGCYVAISGTVSCTVLTNAA
jgi:hypothetical protein